MRLQMCFVVSVSSLLIACASNSYESRPFFQHEYAAESHGQKNILDRIVETNPGGFKVETSPQYLEDPPERIAVLPFADIGSANFVVDKIALTHRSKIERANWAWTDSQRLRRSLDGYLAPQEFAARNQASSAIALTAWPAKQMLAGAVQCAPASDPKPDSFSAALRE
jgi:hypothetical protein